jgi:hypothetical protein
VLVQQRVVLHGIVQRQLLQPLQPLLGRELVEVDVEAGLVEQVAARSDEALAADAAVGQHDTVVGHVRGHAPLVAVVVQGGQIGDIDLDGHPVQAIEIEHARRAFRRGIQRLGGRAGVGHPRLRPRRGRRRDRWRQHFPAAAQHQQHHPPPPHRRKLGPRPGAIAVRTAIPRPPG